MLWFTNQLFSDPTDDCIYIDRDTRIQVIETNDDLPQAEKDQCGAFIVSLFHHMGRELCSLHDTFSVMSDPSFYGHIL